MQEKFSKIIYLVRGAFPQVHKAGCLCDYCCNKSFCVVQYHLALDFSDHDLEAITVYSQQTGSWMLYSLLLYLQKVHANNNPSIDFMLINTSSEI